MSKNTQRAVVIVGAGAAGVPIFNELSKRLDASTQLILVTPRSHFVYLPAAARLVISKTEVHERGFVDQVIWPFTSRFNGANSKIVNGKVCSIADGEQAGEKYVELESGEKIQYTYLVLVPGSRWEGPLAFPDTKDQAVQQLDEWFERFEQARKIVLVGGGGIAYEFAGEFKDEWPDKEITIVHSKQLLLNDTYPDRWRRQVATSLEKRGIKLVLGDRLDDLQPKEGRVTTRSGKVIEADLVLPTRGPRPNTDFIASSMGPEVITSTGHVKVAPTLQLVNHPCIFAGGDIIDWKEEHSGTKAIEHARPIVLNILTLLSNPEAEDLKVYEGRFEKLTLTNGRNGSTTYIGRLWGLTFGDWITSGKKSGLAAVASHLHRVRAASRRYSVDSQVSAAVRSGSLGAKCLELVQVEVFHKDVRGIMPPFNMPSPSPSQTQRTVVIVGAGFAGVSIFNKLSERLDANTKLVLINPRPHLIHLPAACRLVTTPESDFVDKVLLPFTERFNQGDRIRTIIDKVASITDNDKERYVTLENGERVDYTYLVLAPGSIWEGPLDFPKTREETVKKLKEWQDKFEKAQDIVFVGGGGISFEYAGEFRDDWPTKNITVVHSRKLLLNDVYPDHWRQQVNDSLLKRGVNLVLGERVDDVEPKDGKLTTRSGKVIPADLVIPTRGPRPNTAFIASSLGPDVLTTSGHIKVKPTMQLPDYPHIFAAGDAIEWEEQKSARKAWSHAQVVWANLVTLLSNPNATALKTYRGSSEALPLTNGRNGGTTYWGVLWGLTFGDWFTAMMASRKLYIPRDATGIGNMDRCLQAPEILRLICDELPLRQPAQRQRVLALALSCRAFLEPALDRLWYNIDTFAVLQGTLPLDVWSLGTVYRQKGKGPAAEHNKYTVMHFLRAVTPGDLQRYIQYYAPRIREVHIGQITFTLCPEAWHSLHMALNWQSGALAPNAVEIFWSLTPSSPVPMDVLNQAWPYFCLFLGAGASSLHFIYRSDQLIQAASLRNAAMKEGLKELSLEDRTPAGGQTAAKFANDYVKSFSWCHLQSLSIAGLTGDSLGHLSTLPLLKSIKITDLADVSLIHEYEFSDYGGRQPAYLASLPADAFPSLEILELSANEVEPLIGLVQRIPPGNRIHTLTCTMDDAMGSQSESKDFFAALSIHCNEDRLQLLILQDNACPYDWTEDQAIGITSTVDIEQFFKFRQLQSVVINLTESVDLTPQDIHQITASWPNLVELKIDVGFPSSRIPLIDHVDFLTLVYGCPCLEKLGLYFNRAFHVGVFENGAQCFPWTFFEMTPKKEPKNRPLRETPRERVDENGALDCPAMGTYVRTRAVPTISIITAPSRCHPNYLPFSLGEDRLTVDVLWPLPPGATMLRTDTFAEAFARGLRSWFGEGGTEYAPRSLVRTNPELKPAPLTFLSVGASPIYSAPAVLAFLQPLQRQRVLAVALSCRALLEPALDRLWRKVDTFRFLQSTLPPDLWKLETLSFRKQNSWYDYTALRLRRALTSEDLKRYLHYYAPRIRQVHINNTAFTLSLEVWQSLHLAVNWQQGALAPNAVEIRWNFTPHEKLSAPLAILNEAWPYFCLFLSQSTSSLHFLCHSDQPVQVASLRNAALHPMLKEFGLEAKALTLIAIGQPESNCEFVDDFVQRYSWSHLQTLDIKSCTGASLGHLSTLPSLKSLKITDLGNVDWIQEYEPAGYGSHPEYLASLSHEIFPSLEVLELSARKLEDLTGFMQRIPPNNQIHTFNCTLYDAMNQRDRLGEFLTAMRIHCNEDRLRHLSLQDKACKYAWEENFEMPIDGTMDIKQFFGFKKLESVTINLSESVDLTSEDVQQVVVSWPELVELNIDVGFPNSRLPLIDHSDFLTLIYGCRHLEKLGLFFNASRITGSGCMPPSSAFLVQRNPALKPAPLTHLSVGTSPIYSPSKVIEFFQAHCPKLCHNRRNLDYASAHTMRDEVFNSMYTNRWCQVQEELSPP
ncbi:hypothetical protein NMY22_g6850 [Coprinellus aureogranulatus]|nr:hypothetical protein NMY22_g6850 [Coprinellus aureogranulatus]